ncbi:HigA family addiction module antidote protein [Nitratidesulfovibrio sp. HK-II]|uniref:HigA family addiction module antidote protein n=1 Tax=Nitratidesulfovibrio oxamicus TaxID=32016 RepID=A0ABS0J1U2_9BACT|nr:MULTISPECIES: HigA family addiction module antitoxin [Nitratidesulfovibrio]MBG3876117.1 HigA family addiction module antidote protein [Nitratidesulfovibrio oxamicus]
MRIRTHPGEILLEEFLKPLNMTPHALSVEIRASATRINDIVRLKRNITADTATRLARFFGTSSEFWMNLQAAYDISIVEHEKEEELSKIIPHTAREIEAHTTAYKDHVAWEKPSHAKETETIELYRGLLGQMQRTIPLPTSIQSNTCGLQRPLAA